jgi:deoxyguanosine kinase
MNTQNQIILSLGSNLGNRMENIQLAIQSLHNQVGTVIKVSALYETPSWGFESDAFYNCALVMQTSKPAEQLLDEILQLELVLGREKNQIEGYEARKIDIDVIAFNEEIIQTEKLKVPHPHMQNRKFVLLPMRDLNLDWRHPILQKYLPELVALAEDKSSCKEIKKLETPLHKINLQQFNYIAIEGNIGAGKTTLSSKIAEDFNAKLVLERFADNPFLPKFYEDQNRYAFPLEMSFLADRYQQLSDDLAQFDLFKDFIVADYHIFKSLIFAKVTLAEDEYRLYKTMFDIIHKEMPKPDLYIYLYQNTNQLLENI